MYYFVDSPSKIDLNIKSNEINGILSNKTYTYVAIFNNISIFIYDLKNYALLSMYSRSSESLDIYGEFCIIEWSMDSSYIALSTNKGFLYIYSILNEESNTSNSEFYEFTVPTIIAKGLVISFRDVIAFYNEITSLCLYREDLIVATKNGVLNRINWNGSIVYNEQLLLESISFFNDLEYSKAIKIFKCDLICKSIQWFPSFNGITLLFNNGKAAFLHIPNHVLKLDQVTGVWPEHLRHSNCIAVNVKFRSIAFGYKNGDGVIYKFEEETGALKIQHKLKILSCEFPDAESNTGCVLDLKWSPDNFCLLMLWKNNCFSLWSVQGYLIFSTLGNCHFASYNFNLMEWGTEGFSIWGLNETDILILKFAKSILINNSNMNNQRHMSLVSSNSLITNFQENILSNFENLTFIKFPEIYISRNWPIKYVSINNNSSCIAISGKYGFALYFTKLKKWRLFGNENEEKIMEVIGGMVWYNDYICFANYDNVKDEFQIRLYNHTEKIDQSCFSFTVNHQIMILNSYENTLVTLSINGMISFYDIKISQNHKIEINLVHVISLENYIDFAACIVSLHLTFLDSGMDKDENFKSYNCLFINYSGHLLMFHRDNFYKKKKSETISTNGQIVFNGPIVIAYDVENIWIPNKTIAPLENSVGYFMENSLWLNCGSHGLKVWLPLENYSTFKGEYKSKYSFISKRIMINCQISDFAPLVILNNSMLFLAPYNDFASNTHFSSIPILKVKKHIFIHHVIKQLLRINLGIHALELTHDLKSVSYFNHALELLLHEVLEEEATSKEPIPDPLLPRVIAFIQEFPDFLKIVVQCARKTELALWPYLFDSAGDPKDLFENCLINKQLHVAASYLVILQNTESSHLSQKHVVMLLQSALFQSQWKLVKDLLRFLRNIALNDCKTQMTPQGTKSSNNLHKRRYRSGGCTGIKYAINSSNNRFIESGQMKDTELNLLKCNTLDNETKEITIDTNIHSNVHQKNSLVSINSNTSSYSDGDFVDQSNETSILNLDSQDNFGTEIFKTSNLMKEIDVLVTNFAHYLFSNYRIYELFDFVSNINLSENQLILWLIREREKCSVLNPWKAIKILKEDFSCNFKKNKKLTKVINGIRYEYLINNKSSSIFRHNEKKLRFAAKIFYNAKYWNWVLMISLLLEEMKFVRLTLDQIDRDTLNIFFDTFMNIKNKINESKEELVNLEFLFEMEDVIKVYQNNENCENNIENILISPFISHDFNFGQLEINQYQEKIISTDDSNDLGEFDISKTIKLDNIEAATRSNPIKKNISTITKTVNTDSRIVKGSISLENSFNLSNKFNEDLIYTEPLISVESEEKSLRICVIS